jgi:hypothetical protein
MIQIVEVLKNSAMAGLKGSLSAALAGGAL